MISIDLKKTTALASMLVAVTAISCTSAEPTDDPGIDRVGEYLLMSKGPEAEVVVGYRYAQKNLGAPWLILEVAMTSPPRQAARIQRENISLRTPTGATVPLATQREFNEAYSMLQPSLRAADVARDPMDYWPPRKQDCAMRFFVQPGEGVSFDEVTVNDFRACQGRLLFKVPGGVQPGRYILTIDLEESEVRIPFTLED